MDSVNGFDRADLRSDAQVVLERSHKTDLLVLTMTLASQKTWQPIVNKATVTKSKDKFGVPWMKVA